MAVTAALEPTFSSSTGEPRGVQSASPDEGVSGYNVIWDNGMNYDYLARAQISTDPFFVCTIADDFFFTEDQIVRDVHWIGGYWPSEGVEDGDFDWQITFYNDNGTGNQPGTVIESFYFPNAETHETYIGPDMGSGSAYDSSVDLPYPVKFAANTKYWISIQGIGESLPYSGWACPSDPILLHEAVFKSDSFGFPDWTNLTILVVEPSDVCFQLTSGKAEVPALTPVGLIALVSLLSAIAAVAIVRKRH